MKACVISLGCPKNLTDSEVIMGKLAASGYQLTTSEKQADIFVVNTCAFLKSAREEALSTLRSLKKFKKPIYVAGCLPALWGKKFKGYPTIDSIGLHDFCTPRIKATPLWTAYVKIAEGCSNRCSYCLIPKIRGRFRARPVNDILKEVRWLAGRGVIEIIFIAQDTTAHPRLAEILRKTARIKGVRWIRLMYAHPEHLSKKVIQAIKKGKKIVKYLDLPIQHACDKILMKMNRPASSGQKIYHLISDLRREIPKIKLRTSLIVGFPGETGEDFKELFDFVQKVKFDKLGVFEYSREEGTPAAKMRGQVPAKVKRYRYHKLMTLQNRISKELNSRFMDQEMEVLYEGQGQARTAFDAPEIDGSVKLDPKGLRPGKLVKVKVTGYSAYGLSARLVST